jgi:hypothetical protein
VGLARSYWVSKLVSKVEVGFSDFEYHLSYRVTIRALNPTLIFPLPFIASPCYNYRHVNQKNIPAKKNKEAKEAWLQVQNGHSWWTESFIQKETGR